MPVSTAYRPTSKRRRSSNSSMELRPNSSRMVSLRTDSNLPLRSSTDNHRHSSTDNLQRLNRSMGSHQLLNRSMDNQRNHSTVNNHQLQRHNRHSSSMDSNRLHNSHSMDSSSHSMDSSRRSRSTDSSSMVNLQPNRTAKHHPHTDSPSQATTSDRVLNEMASYSDCHDERGCECVKVQVGAVVGSDGLVLNHGRFVTEIILQDEDRVGKGVEPRP